jgi:hypothetical protein
MTLLSQALTRPALKLWRAIGRSGVSRRCCCVPTLSGIILLTRSRTDTVPGAATQGEILAKDQSCVGSQPSDWMHRYGSREEPHFGLSFG